MQLNTLNIKSISDQITCPTYERTQPKTGIIHIGVGGFHRSHQAYYIHKLLEMNIAEDWAICGVGLLETDRKMAGVLDKQNCLYTLVTQHPNGNVDSEVIGSITEYLLAVDTPKLVIDKMAHANTKIVSLTITEGGYNFDSNTGEFNFDNPDVAHDIANPTAPKSVFGFLTAALRKRKDLGLPPFTILSCDNIQHNGDVARKMLLSFAEKQDQELAQWIKNEVTFPNSMVDRITPVTTDEVRNYLKDTYGLEDKWCVVCEPFIQWVIEDNFSNGRPPLEELGVQFVPDVTPYEKMKIRLLNAGHSVLGIPGAIHGHPTIDKCMEDSVFSQFMRKFMDVEATSILGEMEGVDLDKYKDDLELRFSNSNIKDSVSRICAQSSAKLPKFLIPTLRENLESGGSIRYATFILAAWCYYSDKRTDEAGNPLEIIDEVNEALHEAAKNTEGNWTSFLDQSSIFGDLNQNERFIHEYVLQVKSIYKKGNIKRLMKNLILT